MGACGGIITQFIPLRMVRQAAQDQAALQPGDAVWTEACHLAATRSGPHNFNQRYIMHARSNAARGSNSRSSSRHYLLDPAYAVCSTSYTQHHRAIAPSRQHLAGKGHERREVRGSASQTATATSQRDVAAPPSAIDEQLAKDYNSTMKTQMAWGILDPYEYHPQRGLYYHEVAPGLFCGTQPRTPADVKTLRQEQGITTILNLQTDHDMQYWSVDVGEIRKACERHGVSHVRRSARDFDPQSLRKALPAAVQAARLGLANGGRVYVHCTAGLGRAPAVCIASMYWFGSSPDIDLDHAYKMLTDLRPCGPKREAIRGATYDLIAAGQGSPESFDRLPKDAWARLSEEDRYALQWRVLRLKA